jgi:hypothetical protein
MKKHCATLGYVAAYKHEGSCTKFVLNRIDEIDVVVVVAVAVAAAAAVVVVLVVVVV